MKCRSFPKEMFTGLIVGSKLPAAEKFETWLFDTVVPSIRKYGMYATTSMLRQFQENPELIRLGL